MKLFKGAKNTPTSRLICFVLLFGWTLAACSQLPGLQPLQMPLDADAQAPCRSIYPQGEWQLVHAIEAHFPGGGQQTMMGVSQISSARRTIHSVLLTLEGLVLFEARYDGQLTILRALPPFDGQGFAQGMMDDIMLIFLAPAEGKQVLGHQRDHAFVCRWNSGDGMVQDNVFFPDGTWEIRRYDPRHRLVRKVASSAGSDAGAAGPVPRHITLKAFGMLGYDLNLTLVEAQRL